MTLFPVPDPRIAAFELIVERWCLADSEVRSLLAINLREDSRAADALAQATEATLFRISCLLGIYSALHEHLSIDRQAAEWLRKPLETGPFIGSSPLHLMSALEPDGLTELRHWIERGGH